MVSMTSNKTSLEAAAVDAGTTKRAEAGRTVMDGDRAGGSCDPGCVEVSCRSRSRRDGSVAVAVEVSCRSRGRQHDARR